MIKKLFFTFLVSLLSVSFAVASPTPGERVRTTVDEVRSVVKDKQAKSSEAQLDELLKGIIYPVFDFQEMSKRSLGSNWKKGNDEQRKEFVSVFSDLLARTYLKRIRENVVDSVVKISSEDVDGDKATVKTITTSEGEDVSIEYRMQLEGTDWRVYDVIIENVGLVSNYRTEFAGIVRNEGFDGLIKRLREKKAGK